MIGQARKFQIELLEKKQYKESEGKKAEQKSRMVDTIENYYRDKINMLKKQNLLLAVLLGDTPAIV